MRSSFGSSSRTWQQRDILTNDVLVNKEREYQRRAFRKCMSDWHSLLREGRWPGQQQQSDQPVLHDVLPKNARFVFI
jgi:hypothetical protein